MSVPTRFTYGTAVHPLLLDEEGERIPDKARMVMGFRRSQGRWDFPETIEPSTLVHSRDAVYLHVNLKLRASSGRLEPIQWEVIVVSSTHCSVSGRVSADVRSEFGRMMEQWLEELTESATAPGRSWTIDVPRMRPDNTWESSRARSAHGDHGHDAGPRHSVVTFMRPWDEHVRNLPLAEAQYLPLAFMLLLQSSSEHVPPSTVELLAALLSQIQETNREVDVFAPCRPQLNGAMLSLARAAKEATSTP